MSRSVRSRLLALVLVTGASLFAATCASDVAEPTIAFSYNFGDTSFEGFLMDELERTRPEGGERIRVVGGAATFRSEGGGALSAEVRRATQLAEDASVLVAVGPGGSREVLQVVPIFRDAGLAQIIPTATSRRLGAAGPGVFLMAPNDSVQGAFIGAFADSVLHARTAVIIHVPDEYGIGLAAGTAAAFAARGVRLADRIPMRLTLDCGTPVDRAAHDAIADEVSLRGVPDVAVLAVRTVEAGCLARALRARFPGIGLIAGDGTYFDRSFLDRAEGAAEGAYLVAFWHPQLDRPGVREFTERFEARVGRTARHGDAIFFDAVMLAGTAIRVAGARRGRVASYLRAVGSTRPAFEGITGPISFAAGARRTLLMTRVTDRRSEVVR